MSHAGAYPGFQHRGNDPPLESCRVRALILANAYWEHELEVRHEV